MPSFAAIPCASRTGLRRPWGHACRGAWARQVRLGHGRPAPDGASAYAALGIGERSTAAEAKAQYFRICRQLHPDARAAEQAQVPSLLLGVSQTQWQAMGAAQRQAAVRDRFLAAREAYETLSTPSARQRYHAQSARQAAAAAAARAYDPWAEERPAFSQRPQTEDQARRERMVVWGMFGFVGIMLVVVGAQQLLVHEDRLRHYGAEHLQSMRMLDTARGRALEKWREVPPDGIHEFEACRLRCARDMAATGAPLVHQGEFHQLWPHGVGLGLIALLGDSQLCGVESRRRVATDAALADARPATQQALAGDCVVGRYNSPS
ncbi:hypothetical protein LPJ61_001886 [Coemansia biformis]|uniref:J domain-containing protein n=1 Tax=Coemansia biformis TaxID=1286918 RepID=A0A9W7YFK3_9FUNG|nr:hypothetical protein LPJ61_001886 [Coemansia biformis]